MKKKKFNPFNLELVMDKFNYTKEEAEDYIKLMKLKCSTSLEGFIYRHGEEEGRRRYKLKCEKDSFRNTLEGKIDLYGEEEGLKRYLKQNKNNSFSSSLEGKIAKYGEKEGLKIHKEMNERRTISCSKEGYIEKYGEDAFKILSSKKGNGKEVLTKKYGEEKANEIIQNRNIYIKDPIKYYMEKLNISEEEAIIKNYKDKIRGETNLTDEEILKRHIYLKELNKIRKKEKGKQASSQSLCYFRPLTKWLMETYGIKREDILFGDKLTTEKYIHYNDENNNKRHFMYDYCVEPMKIIIEFDGEFFHPPKNLTEKELKEWVNPYGVDGLSIYNNDRMKDKIAEENGYKIFRVRSDEKKILDKLKRIINENQKN